MLHAAYTDKSCAAKRSLTYRLEFEEGGYWVPCEGFAAWSEIYYDADYDPLNGNPRTLTVPEKVVAYIFWEQKLVFVTAAHYDRFRRDTAGYGLTLYAFPSFTEKFCCDVTDRVPFSGVTWIDDDFLEDENAEFDFDAFYRIDKGEKYLNPKHVSVQEIMDFLTTTDMRCRIRRQRGECISFETGERP